MSEILDFPICARPNTSFSVYVQKKPKPKLQDSLIPKFSNQIFHHLTVKKSSEVDSYIQIRPLTTKASANSKNSTPIRKFQEFNKNLSIKLADDNDSSLFSNIFRLKNKLYKASSRNRYKTVEKCVEIPVIQIKKKKNEEKSKNSD